MSKKYNYNDPLDIAEALDKARIKKEQLLAETQKENNENLIKEGEKSDDDTEFFFKNILFFTNDRDSKSNKTLKNLEQAVKGKGVNIYPFVAEEIDYKATDTKIKFNDNVNKYTIDTQSNVDTIVITRLGAQDSNECIELIKELQDWGFFVLNPIEAAETASNKYTSAILMERYGIPQP